MAIPSKLIRARVEGAKDRRDGAWEEFQRTTKVSSIAHREAWEIGTTAEAQVARHFHAHGLEVDGFTNDAPDDGVDGRILSGGVWWPIQAKGTRHRWGNLTVSDGALAKYDRIDRLLIVGVYPGDVVKVGTWKQIRPLVGALQAPTMGGVPWRLIPRSCLHMCKLCQAQRIMPK